MLGTSGGWRLCACLSCIWSVLNLTEAEVGSEGLEGQFAINNKYQVMKDISLQELFFAKSMIMRKRIDNQASMNRHHLSRRIANDCHKLLRMNSADLCVSGTRTMSETIVKRPEPFQLMKL
jgi:hypothetical protein